MRGRMRKLPRMENVFVLKSPKISTRFSKGISAKTALNGSKSVAVNEALLYLNGATEVGLDGFQHVQKP